MAPRPKWYWTLQESKRQACVAIDAYNKSGNDRSFSDFVVHMNLAWLNLLHADIVRSGGEIYHRDSQNKKRFVRGKDGEKRALELRECLKRDFKDNDPVRVNVEFFIGLRDKIEHRFFEHRYQDALIMATAGYAHALVINYEADLVRRFGAKESLAHELRFPVFVQALTPAGMDEQRKLRRGLPTTAKNYITKFESTLAKEVKDDGRFMYRVELVPMKGSRTEADLAFTFTRAADLTPEELAAMEADGKTGKVIVAEKAREVIYKDELRPTPAAKAIEDGIPFVFGVYEFTRVYKAHKVRPAAGAAPESCDTTFCRYFPPGKEYLYTPAYIARCIKELQTAEAFKKLVGREPKRKVTDLASRTKAGDDTEADKTA